MIRKGVGVRLVSGGYSRGNKGVIVLKERRRKKTNKCGKEEVGRSLAISEKPELCKPRWFFKN